MDLGAKLYRYGGGLRGLPGGLYLAVTPPEDRVSNSVHFSGGGISFLPVRRGSVGYTWIWAILSNPQSGFALANHLLDWLSEFICGRVFFGAVGVEKKPNSGVIKI